MVDAGVLVWHAGRTALESMVHLADLPDHPITPANPVYQYTSCGEVLEGGYLNIIRAIDCKHRASDKGND